MQKKLQRPFQEYSFLSRVNMAASCSNNVCAIRRHRRDIQQAIQPHLDRVVDECFLQRVISSETYRQVIFCADSMVLDRLFIAIERGVTRRPERYDVFVQILRDVLPRERAKDLLSKLEATQQQLKSIEEGDVCVRRSSSEPTMSLSRPQSMTYLTSRSLPEGQTASGGLELTMGERGEENGGLHFARDSRSGNSTTSLVGTDDERLVEPVQECGGNCDVCRDRDEFSAAVEERRESGNDPSSLKQRRVSRQSQQNPQVHIRQDVPEASRYSTSGILEAVTRLQHANLECQQREAQITVLNGEVRDLRGQLTTAHERNEKLTLKVQRQSENIETLRRTLNRQISTLRDEAQRSEQNNERSERNNERLKAQVAGLEVDRHALREKVRRVTAQYESRIRDVVNARDRRQRQIATNEAEIPRLQNVIVRKEERIQELSRSVCSRRRHVLFLLIFVSILLLVVAFLLWYFYSRRLLII